MRYPEGLKATSCRQRRECGGILVLIASLVLVLSLFTAFILRVGRVAEALTDERLLVDFHGQLVGEMAIRRGLDHACRGAALAGHSRRVSAQAEARLGEAEARRAYRCSIEGRLIERATGPAAHQGTFRLLRVSSSGALDITAGPLIDGEERSVWGRHQEDEVLVEVREEQGRLGDRRPQIIFLLDYSGSMRGRKLRQLKRAFRSIIERRFPVDYGVILFNDELIAARAVGNGRMHDQRVRTLLRNHGAAGGTAFAAPLQEAVRQLQQNPRRDLFIILMSDGLPSDGDEAVSFVRRTIHGASREACDGSGRGRCLTVYTLGVDGADLAMLQSLSGNAQTPRGAEYHYDADPGHVGEAFEHIIERIVCRYGPLRPGPAPGEEDTLNLFINERALDHSEYQLRPRQRSIEFHREACRDILQGQDLITIRYGRARVYMERL